MQRLDSLLLEVKKLTQWSHSQGRKVVFNLACGRADETGVLWKHFLDLGQAGWYFGCDLREPELKEAQRQWIPPMGADWQVDFRVADASLRQSLPSHAGADLVFIRHQNFWDAPATWDTIYRNARNALNDHGRLMITSYFDREHELALACLKSLGLELLADIPHHAARKLPDAPGKYVDRRVAVFGRESGC